MSCIHAALWVLLPRNRLRADGSRPSTRQAHEPHLKVPPESLFPSSRLTPTFRNQIFFNPCHYFCYKRAFYVTENISPASCAFGTLPCFGNFHVLLPTPTRPCTYSALSGFYFSPYGLADLGFLDSFVCSISLYDILYRISL